VRVVGGRDVEDDQPGFRQMQSLIGSMLGTTR
jgi:hypothetical protein